MFHVGKRAEADAQESRAAASCSLYSSPRVGHRFPSFAKNTLFKKKSKLILIAVEIENAQRNQMSDVARVRLVSLPLSPFLPDTRLKRIRQRAGDKATTEATNLGSPNVCFGDRSRRLSSRFAQECAAFKCIVFSNHYYEIISCSIECFPPELKDIINTPMC